MSESERKSCPPHSFSEKERPEKQDSLPKNCTKNPSLLQSMPFSRLKHLNMIKLYFLIVIE